MSTHSKGKHGSSEGNSGKGACSSDPNHPIPIPSPPKRGDNGKGPHYSTWLLLRYQAGDAGDRPLAPGTVFWESPDVWTVGSKGINQPVAGEATHVLARITNLGMMDATGVTVRYWWANPSIAITEASANLIAIDTVTIPAANSLVFQSPVDWVPTVVNGGHECLLVEAFIPVFENMTDPMQPLQDRHTGQKNEQLVILSPGQQFHFQLEAFNFTTAAQEIAVDVRPGLIPRDFAQRFGNLFKTELLDAVFPVPVELAIGAHVREIAAPKGKHAHPLNHAAPGADCLGPAQLTKTHRFKPGEVRHITIDGALPRNAAPGQVFVVRIMQRIGHAVVGGYTLYITSDPGITR